MIHVRTETGVVAGAEEHGCLVFRGVPYAAPPSRENRFRPPQPVEPWDGVRDATRAGAAAPQPDMDDELETTYFNVPVRGEDFLTTQIWTPDTAGSLPVMVYIHGGAFVIGAGSAPAYSGHTFAQSGVVHVAINYRLGVEGFIYLGEGTDNLGLRDQVAALEWVQRNIAAFGGDPDNVTVCGQSAGALSVFDLLAMPQAEGLFARAIAQSGSPMASVSVAEATKVTRRLARRLRITPTLEAFRATSVEQTVAQSLPLALDFANPLRSGSSAFNLSPFRAVHGTPSLPLPPLEAAGVRTGVPLLTGTVQNETTGFLELLGRVDDINPALALVIQRFLGVDRTVRRAYRDGPRRIESRLALVEAAWSDWALRIPTLRLAEGRADETYVYEFRWNGTQYPPGLSATHALELPFVRDDVDSLVALGPAGTKVVGHRPPTGLAKAMHAAWLGFLRSGDPGWPPYDSSTRTTMVFDETSTVVPDAAGLERAAWTGRR
jgi:carboxylesterase type B